MNDTPTTPHAPVKEPTLRDLFRRFTNAHFATCADEYREGASDAAVERRYEASAAAEKAFLEALDAALEQMRLNGCEAVRRSEEAAKVRVDDLEAQLLRWRENFCGEGHNGDASQQDFPQAWTLWTNIRRERDDLRAKLAATAASASAEVAMLRQRAESSEASLRHIAFTYCGTTLGENGTGFDDVAAFVEGQIDKQDERATRAETQLAAAREDTARLDWLDAHEASIEVNEIDPLTCRVQASDDFQAEGFSDPYKVRAAIDAARAAAK